MDYRSNRTRNVRMSPHRAAEELATCQRSVAAWQLIVDADLTTDGLAPELRTYDSVGLCCAVVFDAAMAERLELTPDQRAELSAWAEYDLLAGEVKVDLPPLTDGWLERGTALAKDLNNRTCGWAFSCLPGRAEARKTLRSWKRKLAHRTARAQEAAR